MGRGCGDNRGEMGREFFKDRPLVKTGVGTSPHRDFAVAPGLPGQPFDDIMAVPAFIDERLKDALGISSTADIDAQKNIAVPGKIHPPLMVGVCDIRRKGKDDRQRLLDIVWLIERPVEFGSVANRDFDSPLDRY